MKTLRDTIHGDIELSPLELEVVDTAAFQRLRGIRQLGTTHLVYPGAQHSRFEHSLGACWLSRRILLQLRKSSGAGLLAGREEVLHLAALLHDITHVPFGHTFEDERRLFPRHDESPLRRQRLVAESAIGTVLRREGVLEDVLGVLGGGHGGGEPARLMRDIVSGTPGADLLDYLRRDAYFCGLKLDYDDRLLQSLSADGDGVALDIHKSGRLRQDALSELIHLLRLRYTLTERVYYHHAKVASGAMVSKALEGALAEGWLGEEDLLSLRDESFLALLQTKSRPGGATSRIASDLLARRLYKTALELRPASRWSPGLTALEQERLVLAYHANTAERARIEADLAREAGLEPGEVIVYCPSAGMQLKEADVRVRVPGGTALKLSELELPEVEVLLEQHRRLWRFSVLVSGRQRERAGKVAALAAEKLGLGSGPPPR